MLSHVWLFVTLCTVAQEAPLSMDFSRQEHSRGFPFSLGKPESKYIPYYKPQHHRCLTQQKRLCRWNQVRNLEMKRESQTILWAQCNHKGPYQTGGWLSWWSSGQDSEIPMQEAPGSISGQGTRSHMLQLRVHMPQLKISHATMNTEDL